VIDRERELGAARALLDGLDDGPRGLLVEGDAGIGKTAIWRSALREAEARGHLVLRCVAEQAEARLSFVGLADLIDGIADDHLSALPAPQREALEVTFGVRGGAAPDRFLVALATLSLFSEAAQECPLLCVVDDAQWLDRASAQALGFVARRLLAEPVAVLVAAREATEAFADLPELVIEGLDDAAARKLLA
jgi:predicted ATPase